MFSRVEYTAYDANDNLLREQRTGQDATFVSRKEHTYDALDRLAQSTVDLRSHAFSENYAYSAGGNIASASNEAYNYTKPRLPQAVTSIDIGQTPFRKLDYDKNGRMVHQDVFEPGDGTTGDRETSIDVVYDAAGCMTQIDRVTEILSASGGLQTLADQTTRHVCGEGGRRVLRSTIDHLSGKKKRVIDFAGLAEIRPDEGIMLLRVPVNGAVMVEEARYLVTCGLDDRQSG